MKWLYSKYPGIHPVPFYVHDKPRLRQDFTVFHGHWFISVVEGTIDMGDACKECARVGPHIEVCLGGLPAGVIAGRFYRETVQERVIEEFHHYRRSVLRARAAKAQNRTGLLSQIDTAKLSVWEHDSHPEELETDKLVHQDFAEYKEWEREHDP